MAVEPGGDAVNAGHMEFCLSDDWREMLEEMILPRALDGVDLGDDVIEIGPGPGFTTDVLRERTARLTAVEIDPVLYEPLAARLSDTNVDVVLGDATGLDLPADRFSAASALRASASSAARFSAASASALRRASASSAARASSAALSLASRCASASASA